MNKNISVANIEPFAYGYLNAETDDVEYRIACGMLKTAEEMNISLDKSSVFATFKVDRNRTCVYYEYGSGIYVDLENLPLQKELYPELSEEIDKIVWTMRPMHTCSIYPKVRTEEDWHLQECKAMWGGDWGGHANPDYHMLLHLGTKGLREKNEHYRKINNDKDVFYDSLNLTLDAIEILAQRASEAAKALYKNGNEDTKIKMSRIIKAFENIPYNPPRDFFEAVQMFWLVFSFDGMDSPGRFDYIMEDYYLLSSEEERKYYLEQLWQLFHAHRAWNLCIGGSDENGKDYSNQLTYDILEVARKFKYNTPNLTMRVHKNTPSALWDSAIKTIGTGIGMPALYNDEVVCPALQKLGISKSDAHEYCMNGCNQIDIFGKSHMGLEDGEVSLAKCLELTLHNGFSPKHGYEVGLKTGEVEKFNTYEEFYGAFINQVKYVTDVAIKLSNVTQKTYAEYAPNPLRSNLIRGCVEKGLDYKNGGPLYGHGQILLEGIADTADSLAAIKHFVFDAEKYTLAELVEALKCDFKGFDELYNDFSGYHKFGNDIEEVDLTAKEIVDFFNDYCLTKKTFRGGVFGGGCSTFNRAANYGGAIGALPNGKRYSSTTLADSIGATPGRDTNGPTALLNSVMNYDQVKAKSGFVLNLKFSKSLFNTEKGQRSFEALAKTYFANGGQQLSVAVLSTEELREAQKHPELYKNLVVRVGGYSEYFNNLSPELQENIIMRSEICL